MDVDAKRPRSSHDAALRSREDDVCKRLSHDDAGYPPRRRSRDEEARLRRLSQDSKSSHGSFLSRGEEGSFIGVSRQNSFDQRRDLEVSLVMSQCRVETSPMFARHAREFEQHSSSLQRAAAAASGKGWLRASAPQSRDNVGCDYVPHRQRFQRATVNEDGEVNWWDEPKEFKSDGRESKPAGRLNAAEARTQRLGTLGQDVMDTEHQFVIPRAPASTAGLFSGPCSRAAPAGASGLFSGPSSGLFSGPSSQSRAWYNQPLQPFKKPTDVSGMAAVALWRPYSQHEKRLEEAIKKFNSNSLQNVQEALAALGVMIQVPNMLREWASDRRRSEVGALGNEALAQVSTLEKQIHRFMFPAEEKISKLDEIRRMMSKHPTCATPQEAERELKQLLDAYRTQSINGVEGALNCLSAFQNVQEWAQPVDDREVQRLVKVSDKAADCGAVLLRQLHRFCYPSCDDFPSCTHSKTLVGQESGQMSTGMTEEEECVGGQQGAAILMRVKKSKDDGTSEGGSLPLQLKTNLNIS